MNRLPKISAILKQMRRFTCKGIKLHLLSELIVLPVQSKSICCKSCNKQVIGSYSLRLKKSNFKELFLGADRHSSIIPMENREPYLSHDLNHVLFIYLYTITTHLNSNRCEFYRVSIEVISLAKYDYTTSIK